jgi:phosphomannomutase
MDSTIFKAYDIRGIYPEQIDKDSTYAIGRAFAIFVKDFYKIEKPKIVVGYDIRNSSQELLKAMTQALIQEGCDVINIGLCTTPLNYFANWHLKVDASVMITASHNPKDYNGFKFSLRTVMALAEVGGIEKIKELVSSPLDEIRTAHQGTIKEQDILPAYLDFLSTKAEGVNFSGIKLAVDCANGMVGPIFEKLAKRIGINYKGIFMNPDGNFPNHAPNPLDQEALDHLKKLMEKESFDLGITFDGDGDRFMVLDRNGKLIKTDFLIALFARFFLPQMENKKILCDARIGRGAREAIEKAGGEIIKSKVGYPHLRKGMKEEEAFFGGELSGHFFWKDFSNSESALLSMIRLFKILKQEKQPIDELIKPIKKYFNLGEINFKIEDKESAIKKLEEKFRNGEISRLDGLTVDYPDWWFNVRPSNTEPFLRLTLEANTQKLFDQKVKELKELIEE